jgi:hypothetical protein
VKGRLPAGGGGGRQAAWEIELVALPDYLPIYFLITCLASKFGQVNVHTEQATWSKILCSLALPLYLPRENRPLHRFNTDKRQQHGKLFHRADLYNETHPCPILWHLPPLKAVIVTLSRNYTYTQLGSHTHTSTSNLKLVLNHDYEVRFAEQTGSFLLQIRLHVAVAKYSDKFTSIL